MITERKKVTAIILLILLLFVMPALASAAGGETSAAPSSTDGANTYGFAYRGSGDTMYNVKFVNENGDVLQDSYVAAGDVPVYKGEEPVKDPDGQFMYIFEGWDPEIVPVTGPAIYTAVYKRMYPFTYFGKDGERLGTAYVEDNSLDLVRVKLKAYRGYEFSGFKIQILNGDGAIICEGEQDVIVDFVPAEALADDVWSKVHADENTVPSACLPDTSRITVSTAMIFITTWQAPGPTAKLTMSPMSARRCALRLRLFTLMKRAPTTSVTG